MTELRQPSTDETGANETRVRDDVNRGLLQAILGELVKMNIYLAEMTDEEI